MEKANWAIAWHDGEFKVLSVTLWVLRKTLISSLFTTLLIPNVSVFPHLFSRHKLDVLQFSHNTYLELV